MTTTRSQHIMMTIGNPWIHNNTTWMMKSVVMSVMMLVNCCLVNMNHKMRIVMNHKMVRCAIHQRYLRDATRVRMLIFKVLYSVQKCFKTVDQVKEMKRVNLSEYDLFYQPERQNSFDTNGNPVLRIIKNL